MYTRQQTKALQRAFNSATVKDHGKKGLEKNGDLKEGFFRTRTNEIIKVSELTGTEDSTTTDAAPLPYDIETEAAKHKFRNLKGIGTDKDGSLKPGFHKLNDDKVISLKHLHDAYLSNLEVTQ